MKRHGLFLLAAALLAWPASAAPEPKPGAPESKPGAPESKPANAPELKPASVPTSSPPQAEIAGIGDDRLAIRAPKWQRAGEENVGLEVQFRWDPTAEFRTATTKDAGTDWVVVFPDRPPVGVEVELAFVYRFSLGKDGEKELHEATVKAADVTIEALVGALDAAATAAQAATADAREATRVSKWNEELKSRFESAISPALKPLAEFSTKGGEGADSVLLKKLGFAAGKDGAWTLGLDSLETASDVASVLKSLEGARSGVELSRKNVSTTAADGYNEGCRSTVEAVTKGFSSSVGLAAVEACVDALVAAAPAASKAELTTAAATLKARAKLLAGSAFGSVVGVNGADAETNQAISPFAGSGATPHFRGLLFAKNVVLLTRVEELVKALEEKLAGEVVERRVKLERSDISTSLLKLEARRRWYDASTGLLYVGGLDDFIMPTMLSVCPFGCMKTDQGTQDYGWSPHVLSVDFGVKAATLDEHMDPRHEDRLGLLLGVSYNPIDVVRLSGGAYLFENRQTNDWNATYYAGITVNVLHAGELLGAIGIKSIPKATITPTSATKAASGN